MKKKKKDATNFEFDVRANAGRAQTDPQTEALFTSAAVTVTLESMRESDAERVERVSEQASKRASNISNKALEIVAHPSCLLGFSSLGID